MGTLIDSSVFIALERRTRPSATLSGSKQGELLISAITASELLHGVHRAAPADQRVKREAFVERLLAKIPVIRLTWSWLARTRACGPSWQPRA